MNTTKRYSPAVNRQRAIPAATVFASGIYGPIFRLEDDASRAFLALDKEHFESVIDFIESAT